MKIINMSETNSLLSQYLMEIRNVDVQGDSLRFRRNIERIGEIIAYEISKTLKYKKQVVETPLAQIETSVLDEKIVTATILRAGLPLHRGFLNYFDKTENAFVSAYRKYEKDDKFNIHIEYIASPRLDEKTVLLVDPMVASGSSVELAYNALLTKGHPSKLHVVCVIASKQGVEYLNRCMPEDATLWCGAIDPELNAHSYIVPGLGDAGDLAYGEKE